MYDAEEYLIRQAFRDAIESREAEAFLAELADRPVESKATSREASSQEPIDDYFADKKSRQRQSIESLQGELVARRDLNRRFHYEIDYQISRAAFSLKEFQFWGIGYNRGVDIKRNFLERQLADFRHKRRQEELRFWDDLVGSREKLREAVSEYRDTLRRTRLAGETK